MEKIFSSAALKTKQREVKDAAMEDAVYAERVRQGIIDGKADIAAGNIIEGTDTLRMEVDKRRAARG